MEPETTPVPGVDDRDLLAAMKALPSVPAASVEDQDRFAGEVHAIAELRCQGGWTDEDESDLAVFVLTPYPREIGDKFGAAPVSHLIATARPILGKIFFLNRDASYGRGMDLPTGADAVVDWLIENGLGTYPAVFVYRGSKMMLVRNDGAAHELSRKEIVRDKPPAATLHEVGDALTLIHTNSLITPFVCPDGVWEEGRAAQYVPGPQPENAIQRELAKGLGSWFRGVLRAEVEDPTSIGRIDVRLLHQQPDGHWVYWAVLELKVIRSCHNASKGKEPNPVSLADNASAVAEGVRQIYAFAKHWNAEGLLEVFDMRKNKMPDVLQEGTVTAELAKCAPPPPCRTWHLFGSASDARIAGYS